MTLEGPQTERPDGLSHDELSDAASEEHQPTKPFERDAAERQRELRVRNMRESLDRKNAQVAELRATLLDTRRQLNSKLEEARAQIRHLKRRLALYERRQGMKTVDAFAHNSEASMDDFFQDNEDPEPYVRFGSALRLELRKRGITLERRRVADAGVGPAIALKELLRGSEPASVFGFDFSAAALEKARAVLPTADFEQRDIYSELPARFHVIICTEVLEHLERPSDALRVLAEGLAPDGSLILTVPDGRIDFSSKHINFWSPESWVLFLNQNLPECRIETGVFQPYPETGHQTNIGIVRGRES